MIYNKAAEPIFLLVCFYTTNSTLLAAQPSNTQLNPFRFTESKKIHLMDVTLRT